jgi:hypothetical protein
MRPQVPSSFSGLPFFAARAMALILVFLAVFLRNPADAGVGTFCPVGPCNYTHPTYVNVYWDTNPAQWDTDVGGAASGLTQAQIDSFTAAMVHSSYFSQLAQYGVVSASVLPSITVGSQAAGEHDHDAREIARVSHGSPPDIDVAETGGITGAALDASRCGVENTPLELKIATGPTSSPIITQAITTESGGYFATTFKAPEVAGLITASISLPTPASSPALATSVTRVHPKLVSLSPPQGAIAGGQQTVLTGAGFDSSTSVSLGANAATVLSTSSDHKTARLLTPASTLSGGTGPVYVSATVHNVSAYGLSYNYIVPDLPVMEFLGSSQSGPGSPVCNSGQIKVSLFNADGSLEQGQIELSASYPAFEVGLQRRQSETVSSGSTVTIFGGGPITAVNPKNATSTANATFPILPNEICRLVAAVKAKVDHIVAWNNPVFHPFGQGRTVFWGDAEDPRQVRNFVYIEGDMDVIQRKYQVSSVAGTLEQELIAKNPIVYVSSKSGNAAGFAGPMVIIQEREAINAQSPLPERSRISFALPRSGAQRETYAIMRLQSAGDRQVWIEAKGSKVDREKRVVTADAQSTGEYALVRLFSDPSAMSRGGLR